MYQKEIGGASEERLGEESKAENVTDEDPQRKVNIPEERVDKELKVKKVGAETDDDIKREAEVEKELEREVNDSEEKSEEEHIVENTEAVEEPERKLNASMEPKVKNIGAKDEAVRKKENERCFF